MKRLEKLKSVFRLAEKVREHAVLPRALAADLFLFSHALGKGLVKRHFSLCLFLVIHLVHPLMSLFFYFTSFRHGKGW
jgi:hypothetical protein